MPYDVTFTQEVLFQGAMRAIGETVLSVADDDARALVDLGVATAIGLTPQTGSAAAQFADTFLAKADNLASVASASTSRTSLGLGSMATESASDYAAKAASNTFSASQVIQTTDNTNAALRVTQLGTGEAIRVEDSANPDSSPFVIDANGEVGIGASPFSGAALNVFGLLRNHGQMNQFASTNSAQSSLTVTQLSQGLSALFTNTATATADCVRITNLGTGNSFVVEDSTNPDSSPFRVTADGRVGIQVNDATFGARTGNLLVAGGVGVTASQMLGRLVIDATHATSPVLEVINFGNGGGVLVTNTGTGASLRVNDEASDTTPFIVDASGNVGVKIESPTTDFEVNGNAKVTTLSIGSSAAVTGVASYADVMRGVSSNTLAAPDTIRRAMNSHIHAVTAGTSALTENGGGSTSAGWNTITISTSATLANSFASRFTVTGSANTFPWAQPGHPGYKMDFSKVIAVCWTIGGFNGSPRVPLSGDGWVGCFCGQGNRSADVLSGLVTTIGFGWKLDAAGDITVSARNASGITTSVFASGFDMNRVSSDNRVAYEVYQYSDGAGNLYTYVDGVLKSTITAGPTTFSDISTSFFCPWLVAVNNGTSVPTGSSSFTLYFPIMYIGR